MDDAKRDIHAAMASSTHPADEETVSGANGASSSDGTPATVEARSVSETASDVGAGAETAPERETVAVAEAPAPDGAMTLADESASAITGSNGPEALPATEAMTDIQPIPAPIAGRPMRQDVQDASVDGVDAIVASPLDEAILSEQVVSEETAPSAKAVRRPIWSMALSVIVGSRWILAIPAVWLALTTGWAVEQARSSPTVRPLTPPDDSWPNFALAGLLLVIAVFPRRLPGPEGGRADLRNLRTKNIDAWLDFAVLIGASALVAAVAVYAASKVELVNWAVVTWLWPFLKVSTSNLEPLTTMVIGWLVLFLALVVAGLLATFIPGLRPAGPSVFLRELTRTPEIANKPNEAPAQETAVAETAQAEMQEAPTIEMAQVTEAPPTQETQATETAEAISDQVNLSDTLTSTQGPVAAAEGVSTTTMAAMVDEKPATETAPETKKEKLPRQAKRAIWRRVLLFFVPLALSLLCVGASIPLFMQLNQAPDPNIVAQNWWVNNGSWLLWIASMVLFGLTFVIWERTTRPPEAGDNPNAPLDRFPRWLEWVIMLALFGIAIYLRVKDLATVPSGLWFDEGQDGLVGRQLVAPNGAHPTFIGDWTQMGALLWYFMGLVIKFMGNTIIAVRLIPAVMGALIAPMLYMLGARLYGWRAGLAAGGLVAMLDWNITWSRIGMASIPTVALVVAIYLCMVQALRTGRLGYYAGAGILMGLSLHMYYVSKLVPVVFIVLLVHKLVTERMRLIRSLRAGVVVLVLGAAIALVPVGLFAVQRPDLYNARTSIVWIASPENSPNRDTLKLNLESNVKAHGLMFNWQGDGNGRHNLPGTPMLDWITASLLFAGLASCLLRIWRWQYAFPIVWGAAAISGGVFTLPFEAPQSHRTLELSVVSALIAGIFIGQAWEAVSGARMMERLGDFGFWILDFGKRASKRSRVEIQNPKSKIQNRLWPARLAWVISGATLLVVVWLAGNMNLNKYFNVQAQDLSVVKDMQSPQAEAARQTLLYGSSYDVYVTPLWQGVPQSQYLAPDVQTIAWPGLQALPLTPGKPGGTIIILDLPSVADMQMIARIYPHAHFDIYTAASNPEPLVTTIKIPDSDIRAGRGVMVTSRDASSGKSSPGKLIPDFSYDWSSQGARPGTLRFSTTLKVDQFGTYSFSLKSAVGADGRPPLPGELLIDGYSVSAEQPITLAMGLHSVVATDTVKSAVGAGASTRPTTQLLWSPPPGGAQQPVPSINLFDPTKVEPHGLTGNYRPGTAFEGASALARVDPVISYYFHNTPLPLPFTTDWQGSIYIPEDGPYTFGTEQLSSSVLSIDGKQLINNTGINNLQEGQVNLTTGFHDLRLQFIDAGSASHMYLYWTPPGRGQSIIPSIFLWPKMGTYVGAHGRAPVPESGEWPTLDDSDGKQIPPDRVTYTPPRVESSQPAPNPQPPAGSAPPPAEQQPQQPASKGKTLQPLFLVGDNSIVGGRPRAGGADKDGNIYIFTERDSKIHKYDPQGKQTSTSWAVKDASGGLLTEGSGLVVKDDHVYVLDAKTSDLLGFTLDGQPAGNIHLCSCFFPRDVALASDGNFWIANTGNGQLFKIDAGGGQVGALGQKGDKAGEFNEPAGASQAKDGTLFVMDTSNKRVQSFGADLKPLAQWPVGSSIARDGNRLAADGAGNVLVTQAEGHAIVKYDKNGKELDRWVYRRGGAELTPAGIAWLGGDKFLVMFPENDVAVVFSTAEK